MYACCESKQKPTPSLVSPTQRLFTFLYWFGNRTIVCVLVQKHGLDKLSAAIHVQLKQLSVKEKARISKLSAVDMEEMKGQIMLQAAKDTLSKAAAQKKQTYAMLKSAQIGNILKAPMLQEVNATEGNLTNSTAEVDEEESSGAFDLWTWLDQQPDRYGLCRGITWSARWRWALAPKLPHTNESQKQFLHLSISTILFFLNPQKYFLSLLYYFFRPYEPPLSTVAKLVSGP